MHSIHFIINILIIIQNVMQSKVLFTNIGTSGGQTVMVALYYHKDIMTLVCVQSANGSKMVKSDLDLV